MRLGNKVIYLLIVLLSGSAFLLPGQFSQSNQTVSISSPSQGEMVTGVVEIVGSTVLDGFAKAELAFANAIDPTNTWFPISQSTTSVESGLLATWDTTLITDGEYRLRLQVISVDKSVTEFVISSITIRNYSPISTFTPTRVQTIEPTTIKLIATNTPVLFPTKLPENPLILSGRDFSISIFYGVLAVLILVFLSNIYFRWLRK